ncbi:MAG: YihY/virulence factor BrkB family protein [Muribaculaceae bacterium]|nr:YihY/virulence factor BrkB family protein [Muribaculaceae bacterium]
MAAKKESKLTELINRIQEFVNYCWSGVWKETRDTSGIRTIKVLNLSVRSFLDRDLQSRSMSLTYSTVLAIVPAFALLFAIGRGFGFQNLLEDQLYQSFPAQRKGLEFALKFVDSYLKEASQGLFVGIGIVFLLWTLISLLSYIESSFNHIWDVKHDRSFYQKVTDYTSICLMVPVLMICSSGVSIFMSAIVQDNIHFAFLSPLVNIALETSPVVLAWLAFSLSFFLIPNTKVKFKYAAISGAICAIVFQILQMLFVNGQIYVSKYNAIYGSFAFLPLLLIWLQLSWLILLFGCVLTYSLQNVLNFNFIGDIKKMSENYERKVTIILTAAIVSRFRKGKTPLTRSQLSFYYDIPIQVVTNLCEQLQKAGFINYVMLPDDRTGVAPATETGNLTVGELLRRLDHVGDSNFIPRFSLIYRDILDKIDSWLDDCYDSLDTRKIADIDLPEDIDKEKIVNATPKPFIHSDDSDVKPVSSDD